MPIAAHLKHYYGHAWRTVTRPAILLRFGGVFDEGRYLAGSAHCAKCGISGVLLDCAHLSGDASDSSEENTAAMCRRCHRTHDYREWAVKYRAWQGKEIERRKQEKDLARPLLQAMMEARE